MYKTDVCLPGLIEGGALSLALVTLMVAWIF
jgi:hypothetical protein